ncbi:MAG TPA: nucleotidyltransferase domain-containing protein [Candidatus Tectomicrobia bacterium]|nr:nucleotidyltransferase domain-containing protein [Candidatus Tectomicrobia bacterium]
MTAFNWRRALSLALDQLHQSGVLRRATVILVGSYAQGTPSPHSDVDVLILISGSERPKLVAPRGIHYQFADARTFRERIRNGDDYAIAAIRFGKLLHDGLEVWVALKEEEVNAPLPDWRLKFDFARRRLRLTRELLRDRDTDAAAEECLAAATQLARGYLLRRGVYPFSRPQLSGQLDSIGEAELARILRLLQRPALEESDLRKIALRLEALSSPQAA